jgi:hypothetical protein
VNDCAAGLAKLSGNLTGCAAGSFDKQDQHQLLTKSAREGQSRKNVRVIKRLCGCCQHLR